LGINYQMNAPKPLCDSAETPYPCREGNVFGGNAPARTWFHAMKPLLDPLPVLPLPPTDPRYVEGGAESRVPNVVGKGLNDARAILDRAGWKASTHTVDNRADKGTVVGQDPNGTALPGETILLQVSSGEVPPPPPAPDGNDDNSDNSDNNSDSSDSSDSSDDGGN